MSKGSWLETRTVSAAALAFFWTGAQAAVVRTRDARTARRNIMRGYSQEVGTAGVSSTHSFDDHGTASATALGLGDGGDGAVRIETDGRERANGGQARGGARVAEG